MKYIIGIGVVLVLALTFYLIIFNEKARKLAEEKKNSGDTPETPDWRDQGLLEALQGVFVAEDRETELSIADFDFMVEDLSGELAMGSFFYANPEASRESTQEMYVMPPSDASVDGTLATVTSFVYDRGEIRMTLLFPEGNEKRFVFRA